MQGRGPALGGSESHAVLCETCSVLLCVRVHSGVDNSGSGPNLSNCIKAGALLGSICDVSHSTATS